MGLMIFRRWIFIIVLGLGLQGVGFAETQATAVLKGSDPSGVRPQQALPEVETYDQLLSAIRKARKESRERIEEAVERENVREAWETGKLIDTHVLHHKERADYDKQVLLRLAGELETSDRELYYMLKFARVYPISRPAAKLSWSHWQALLSIDDSKQRDALAEKAEKEGWTRDRLRAEVRRLNQESKRAGREEDVEAIHELRLQATPGKVGTYRVILAKEGPFKGRLALDLGFATYHRPKKIDKFKEGDIVTLEKGKLKKMPGGTDKDRYTYQAYILEVIDGDSFTAVIDLGFEMATAQTLRLRGLDAPEIESREGKEAKEFLDSLIVGADPRVRPLPGKDKDVGPTHGSAPTHEILIRTVKSDKYDRYLVDIWVGDVYVNQALVEQGLAWVVEG